MWLWMIKPIQFGGRDWVRVYVQNQRVRLKSCCSCAGSSSRWQCCPSQGIAGVTTFCVKGTCTGRRKGQQATRRCWNWEQEECNSTQHCLIWWNNSISLTINHVFLLSLWWVLHKPKHGTTVLAITNNKPGTTVLVVQIIMLNLWLQKRGHQQGPSCLLCSVLQFSVFVCLDNNIPLSTRPQGKGSLRDVSDSTWQCSLVLRNKFLSLFFLFQD